MISHLELNIIEKLSESVTVKANKQGAEFIVIDHPELNAAFALQGAHLIHFQAKQQTPLIYLSKTALYQDGKAIRGGVPICWPWFAAPGKNLSQDLPSHGFARTTKWKLLSVNETKKGVELEFIFTSNKATKAIWNNDFSLKLKAILSDHIELSLATTNTGKNAFTYRGALHSYLNVGNIVDCSIEGLANNYIDSLKKTKCNSTEKRLITDKAIDSIYSTSEQNIIVNDDKNKRKITVKNAGNDSVVVWNPWKEGASLLVDMQEEDYQNMLCVESSITSENGILINAGNTHILETSIF